MRPPKGGTSVWQQIDGKSVFNTKAKWNENDAEGSSVHLLEIERMSHLGSMLIQIEQLKNDNKVIGTLAAPKENQEKDSECVLLEEPLLCSYKEGESIYVSTSLSDEQCIECPSMDDCDECTDSTDTEEENTPTPTPTMMHCNMFGWRENPNKDHRNSPYHWWGMNQGRGKFDEKGNLTLRENPWKDTYGGAKTKFKKGDYVCDGHSGSSVGSDDKYNEDKTHCYKCIKEFDIGSIIASYTKDLYELEKQLKAQYKKDKTLGRTSDGAKIYDYRKVEEYIDIYFKYKEMDEEFRPIKRRWKPKRGWTSSPGGHGDEWIPNTKYWEQSTDCDDCTLCDASYKRKIIDKPEWPECPDCVDECDATVPFEIQLNFELPKKEDSSGKKVLTESSKKIKAQAEWAAKVWQNCICDYSLLVDGGHNNIIINVGVHDLGANTLAGAIGYWDSSFKLVKRRRAPFPFSSHGFFLVSNSHINGRGNKLEDTVAFSNPHGKEITALQETILHEMGHILGIVTANYDDSSHAFGGARNFIIDANAKEFDAKYNVVDLVHTYGRDRGSVSPWEIGTRNSKQNEGKWWKYYKKSSPFYKADSYFLGKSEVLGSSMDYGMPDVTATYFDDDGEWTLASLGVQGNKEKVKKAKYAVYKIKTQKLPEIDYQGTNFSKIGIGDLVTIDTRDFLSNQTNARRLSDLEDQYLNAEISPTEFYEQRKLIGEAETFESAIMTHGKKRAAPPDHTDAFDPLRNPDVIGYIEKIENKEEYSEITVVKYNAPAKKHSELTAIDKIKKGQELRFYGSKAVIEFKKWHILNSPNVDVTKLPYAIPLYHNPELDWNPKTEKWDAEPKSIGGSRLRHWSEDKTRVLPSTNDCSDIGAGRSDIACLPMGTIMMSPKATDGVSEPLTTIELGMLTDIGARINWGCVKNIPKWRPPPVDECSRCDEVCMDPEDEDCYLSDEYGSPEECREKTFDCENKVIETK